MGARMARSATRLALCLGIVGLALGAGLSAPRPARADPPPWAPAHGARDGRDADEGDERRDDRRDERRDDGRDEQRHHDHDRRYRGYDDRGWDNDYGVQGGHCNRAAVGAVLGGIVGGVVGSQVARDSERPVAIIIGALLGSVVGHEIGRDMDEADRGCMGHALELARDGRPVEWRNQATGVAYVVTPLRPWPQGGPSCRAFRLRSVAHGRPSERTAHACRSGDGEWRIRER
jgi:surface antigen